MQVSVVLMFVFLKPDGHERVLTLQLEWEGERKPVSTIFIGSSPEFELSLYTLYFLAGSQQNYVNFLNYRLDIRFVLTMCGSMRETDVE